MDWWQRLTMGNDKDPHPTLTTALLTVYPLCVTVPPIFLPDI